MAQESDLRNVIGVMDGGGRGRNPDAVPGKMTEILLTPCEVAPLLYPPTDGADKITGPGPGLQTTVLDKTQAE